MSRIEDHIRNEKGIFNNAEPSSGHISRFEALLEKENNKRKQSVKLSLFKMAAIVLLLISVSYFGWQQFIVGHSDIMAQAIQIEYTGEMEEVIHYYDAASKLKIEEIEDFALNPEENEKAQKKAKYQLDQIDARLAQIEKEYIKNPGNKQLKAALVNTKRKKSQVINQIVKQMEIAQSGYYSVNTETIQF